MEPLKKKPDLEKVIYQRVRRALEADGWLVEKTHGSMYQVGWPDLFLCHPRHGMRWVELKRPREGKLKPSQEKKFARWQQHGVGIWILTGVADIPKLFEAPNWYWWLA